MMKWYKVMKKSSILGSLIFFLMAGVSMGEDPLQFGTPKKEEGTRIFKADENPFYTGQFNLTGSQTALIGRIGDEAPWDHMDYAGHHLQPVSGQIEINVNERENSGIVTAEFTEGQDHYKILFNRFTGKAPYQDGGIATRVYEHGDSGNGDPLYPKTWLYLAGWGTADVLKNGQMLFKDYSAHFMVMERSRDPKTHVVRYPVKRTLPGGETDPSGMEIDLWVRSKETNSKNFPPFEAFIHLMWEEVTWR